MPDDIETWKNRDPNNKSLEELSLLITQILEYLDTIETRIETLEALHP